MRSCRRLNARATLFSGLSRNRGGRGKKKRKKRGWKKCIRRYPDYSIHGQSPAFRQPRSRDEKAILEGISSVYQLFSRFFLPSFSLQLAWRKGQLSDSLSSLSLSLPSFHVSREKLSKFIDCSRWRLISNFVQIIPFFFCEKFEKFKKRFFESIFLPYNIWISQKYFQIFSRGNLLKSVFSTESLRVEFPIERYSNYIYMVYKTHGYYREDLWIRDSTNIAANFKAN